MDQNRNWMWQRVDDNCDITQEFAQGVDEFLNFAYSNAINVDRQGQIKCPCIRCKNMMWKDRDTIECHLLFKGFMEEYSFWDVHGECRVVDSANVVPNVCGASSGHRTQQTIEQMVVDGFGAQCYTDPINDHCDEPSSSEVPVVFTEQFQHMMRDTREPLWDGCNKSVLEAASELMHHKVEGKISERVFDGLLQTIKSILPNDEKLPESTYHIKKKMKHLELEYIKIHACINNCMLFYKEDAHYKNCLVCGHSRYKTLTSGIKKGIPYKTLHYLPIIPRLQRLFTSERTAGHMCWHASNRNAGGMMQHPTDSEAWNHFNTTHPSFAADPRNVRLGISTDGFAPFNHYGKKHSCWPVIITVYNLPPWMCMKEPYLFLNSVIPGYPGKSINIFLRPLIDELLLLWNVGVHTIDVSRKETLLMRAAVMWTISDFPAYALLSGWRTQGNLSCPICMEQSRAFGLTNGKKTSFFDCHRCSLPHDHPFRKQRDKFRKGTVMTSGPPRCIPGDEVYMRVSALPEVSYNKKDSKQQLPGYGCDYHWIMRSVFWELPYWKTNLLRHCLDVMHIEKNVFENIWNTVMDVKGKTKDNAKARADLQLICKRHELELYEENGKWVQPNASFVLPKEKQRDVYEWLKTLRFPDGYSSNISRCIDVEKLHLTGLKTHDCHVLLQRILPVAFRDMLPTVVWETITEVGHFLRDLCSQSLHIDHVKQLKINIVVTLCKLEKIFPPSFFDPSVHLLVHLADESLLRGPAQYTSMYCFERFLGKLKTKVGNKAHIKSSICKSYLIEETSTFCCHYFDPSVRTRQNKLPRSDDGGEVHSNSALSTFRHPGQGYQPSRSKITMDEDEQKRTHSYVLLNTPEILPYIRLFDETITRDNPGISDGDLDKFRSAEFGDWFHKYVIAKSKDIDEDIYEIGLGPSRYVKKYAGYFTNGFNFHTEKYGASKCTMNSGVWVTGGTDGTDNVDYFGMLQEVWELEYFGVNNKVVLFKCIWYDTFNKLRVHHNNGLAEIDHKSRLQSNDQFVLASQAQQVYYMSYPSKKQDRRGWWAICKTSSRGRYKIQLTDAGDPLVDDELSYQEAESQFPVSTDMDSPLDDDGVFVQGNGGVEVPYEDIPVNMDGEFNNPPIGLDNVTEDECSILGW